MLEGEEFPAGGTATANTCGGNKFGTLGYRGGGSAAGGGSGGGGRRGLPPPAPAQQNAAQDPEFTLPVAGSGVGGPLPPLGAVEANPLPCRVLQRVIAQALFGGEALGVKAQTLGSHGLHWPFDFLLCAMKDLS